MIPVAVILLSAAATVPADPSVRRVPFDGGERIDLVLDGPIVDVAVVGAADGRRSIDLLAGEKPGLPEGSAATCTVREDGAPPPSAAARRILRVPSLKEPTPTLVGQRLDPTTSHLSAFDLDGDGAEEWIVGRRGTLEAWRDGTPTPLVSNPGVETVPGSGRPRGPWKPGRLHVFDVGSVVSFGPREDGTGWTRRGGADLPREVRLGARSIRLRTLPFVPVGPSKRGGDILASDPESVDEERLRIWRVEPEGVGAATMECWARLPGPERRIDADFVVLDGEPALVVITMRADKLEIFGEKRLRVFRLEADRTKTGISPFLSAETGANLWQTVQARVADLDGDGRDDLVLVYWKGLKNEKVAFDVWSRDADGNWPGKPSGGSLDVPDADTSFLAFGDDLDGDALPDLLVAGRGGLRVHRGIALPRRGVPVEKDPAAVLPLPEGVENLGTSWVGVGPQGIEGGSALPGAFVPRPADLDGDGVAEILLRDGKRPERISIYRWTPREGR